MVVVVIAASVRFILAPMVDLWLLLHFMHIIELLINDVLKIEDGFLHNWQCLIRTPLYLYIL